MDELTASLMAIIVPALTTIVGVLVAWGLAELRKFVATKTKNEGANQALFIVSDLVQSSVETLNQTTRKVFDDGKMSTAEKRELKRQAKGMIMRQIPAATKKILDANLNDLQDYVDSKIEQAVVRAPKKSLKPELP